MRRARKTFREVERAIGIEPTTFCLGNIMSNRQEA